MVANPSNFLSLKVCISHLSIVLASSILVFSSTNASCKLASEKEWVAPSCETYNGKDVTSFGPSFDCSFANKGQKQQSLQQTYIAHERMDHNCMQWVNAPILISKHL